jgi:uncharacterized protein
MFSRLTLFALATIAAASPVLASPAAGPTSISAAGPMAPLQGTLQWPTTGASSYPTVLIIPGSGPTDRDGNNPMGVRAASYRLLAHALADNGVASVRYDKRGIGASAASVADGNAVTVADYVRDVDHWLSATLTTTGARCVWLMGHSEGGLIALAAANDPRVCGLILIAVPGRRLDITLREQLSTALAGTPLLAPANAAIDALAAGQHVSTEQLPGPLASIFAPAVQDYLIDLIGHDPALLIAATRVPTLIVQGNVDLQVSAADAHVLADAQPAARLIMLPHVNHVLKTLPDTADRSANIASYGDPALPVSPQLVAAITTFITAHPASPEHRP